MGATAVAAAGATAVRDLEPADGRGGGVTPHVFATTGCSGDAAAPFGSAAAAAAAVAAVAAAAAAAARLAAALTFGRTGTACTGPAAAVTAAWATAAAAVLLVSLAVRRRGSCRGCAVLARPGALALPAVACAPPLLPSGWSSRAGCCGGPTCCACMLSTCTCHCCGVSSAIVEAGIMYSGTGSHVYSSSSTTASPEAEAEEAAAMPPPPPPTPSPLLGVAQRWRRRTETSSAQ